jgi:hypothetical protein
MDFGIDERRQLAQVQGGAEVEVQARVDLYASIHKALRAMLCDSLLGLGRMDPDDDYDVVRMGQRIFELLETFNAHLEHENTFVHPAMEARAPRSSRLVAQEHQQHEVHIAQLSRLTGALIRSAAAQRGPVVASLYRALSLFAADNFQHMAQEESEHNAVLWANFSDAELIDIHAALVAAIAPPELLATMRWMVPFCSPAERAAMLLDMRVAAPTQAFAAVLDIVRPHLDDAEWTKLAAALASAPGLDPVPLAARE